MKMILSSRRHHYLIRVSILLIAVALIAGMVGCGGGGVEYDLTIASTAGGSVSTPGEGTYTYDEGAVVNLVATPDAGYEFVNWTGDVGTIGNVNAATTIITTNGDYSITANFVAVYDLTISSTEGGSVTAPREGTFTYDEGTVVSLVATPDAGYDFVNWTGDVGTIADVNDATTTITMNGDYSITANFGEEQVVIFPDPGLEAAIREEIGKPEGDIYQSELEELTSLVASQRSITDLTGLEHGTSLTVLELHDNQISDISPLASLTNLTEWLGLSDNQISDISPLANLTSLTGLELTGNQISDISPLASLTNLTEWLGLSDNQISDISPLANLTSLTELTLDVNQISDISPLANLTNLTQVRLSYNQIGDIEPLVNNPGLSEGDEVYLTGNPLSWDSINIYIPQLEARGVIVDY